MGLKFSVLSSGSTGNATIVASKEATLLVDVGLTTKNIEQLLQKKDLTGFDLDGIFITHEHSDHIRGLRIFARKYNLPIYANEKTWGAMGKGLDHIPQKNRKIFPSGSSLELQDMRISSYEISHDAVAPVGYHFISKGKKLSLTTDLGYLSDKVLAALKHSDVLVLEANHDIEMLRSGQYPWNTKRRILSDTGHLSNEAAGEALCRLLDQGRLKRVYLAHLSQKHNQLDLAKLTVNEILRENGLTYGETEFQLCDTHPYCATPWDDLTGETAEEAVGSA